MSKIFNYSFRMFVLWSELALLFPKWKFIQRWIKRKKKRSNQNEVILHKAMKTPQEFLVTVFESDRSVNAAITE